MGLIQRTDPEHDRQLATIIFFVAFVQMMYYLGVMQWIIKNLCVLP
jgi:nucleoside permease NupC